VRPTDVSAAFRGLMMSILRLDYAKASDTFGSYGSMDSRLRQELVRLDCFRPRSLFDRRLRWYRKPDPCPL